jgi:hypothetical protein
MTINQQIQLFSNIADAHKQIKDFGFGEPWQIEEAMNKKKGVKYPMMWVAPISSTTFEQVEERTYMFMIFDLVSKTKEADKNNRNEVWSDAEDILKDPPLEVLTDRLNILRSKINNGYLNNGI